MLVRYQSQVSLRYLLCSNCLCLKSKKIDENGEICQCGKAKNIITFNLDLLEFCDVNLDYLKKFNFNQILLVTVLVCVSTAPLDKSSPVENKVPDAVQSQQKPTSTTYDDHKVTSQNAEKLASRPARNAPETNDHDNDDKNQKDQKHDQDKEHRVVRQISDQTPNDPKSPQQKQPVPEHRQKRDKGSEVAKSSKPAPKPAGKDDHKLNNRETAKDKKNGDSPKGSQRHQRQDKPSGQQKSGTQQKSGGQQNSGKHQKFEISADIQA